MGRIHETSEKYRTKAQMIDDVVTALNSSLSYAGKFSVLKTVCWHWTEFNGKYKGCEWWTANAMKLFDTDPKTKFLRHEHAVPRAVVMEMLFGLKPATAKLVEAICEKLLIGVVVTLKDDSVLSVEFRNRMPPEFSDESSPEHHDPWLRYKRCGLKVVQRCCDA